MSKSATSDYRTERVVKAGSLSFTNGDYGSVDSDFGIVGKGYTHNLGYRPLVRAFAEYPNGMMSDIRNIGPKPDSDIEILAFVSTTKVFFNVYDNQTPDRTVTIYYRIYTEEQ